MNIFTCLKIKTQNKVVKIKDIIRPVQLLNYINICSTTIYRAIYRNIMSIT